MGNSLEKLYDRIDRRISREIHRLCRLSMAQNREIQLIFRILHKRYMKFEQVDMHDAISAGIHVRTLAVAAKINNMQKRLKALNKHFEKEADNTSC